MLSFVVTVILLGLAASDPSPPKSRKYGYRDPYPGPQQRYHGRRHPIGQVGPGNKHLPSPKVHTQQVGLLHQQAVPVPQTKVFTNERVKVVKERIHVPVPQVQIKKIIQQVPLETIKKVPSPVVYNHKEMIPVIKERVKNIFHRVPQVMEKTVIRNVATPVEIPKIQTKHVHHVRTKVMTKNVPAPYRVDNMVPVPKHFVHKAPVPYQVNVPKIVDRVVVKTKTKVVPQPMIQTVIKPEVRVKTEYKTIQKNVPVPQYIPQHVHHTRVVKQHVPVAKPVYKTKIVPQFIEKIRVHNVQVPVYKTNTVVKTKTVPQPIPHLVTKFQTVKERIPVPYQQTVIKPQPFPVAHPQVVEKVVNHIQKVAVPQHHVRTVHKTHAVPVPKIVKEIVPQVHVRTIVKPQLIVKETHKETVQPVQQRYRQSVQYYRINADGSRSAITPVQVRSLLSSGAISQSQIGTVGGAQGFVAGSMTGGVHRTIAGVRNRAGRGRYRTNNGRYAIQGLSGPVHAGISGLAGPAGHIQAGAAGIAAMRGGSSIGSINLQAVGGAGPGHAAMINNAAAAHQAAIAQGAAAFPYNSRYAGMSRGRHFLPRMFQQLNKKGMTEQHILAKVARK